MYILTHGSNLVGISVCQYKPQNIYYIMVKY